MQPPNCPTLFDNTDEKPVKISIGSDEHLGQAVLRYRRDTPPMQHDALDVVTDQILVIDESGPSLIGWNF